MKSCFLAQHITFYICVFMKMQPNDAQYLVAALLASRKFGFCFGIIYEDKRGVVLQE